MKKKTAAGDDEKIQRLLGELPDADLIRYLGTALDTFTEVQRHFLATFADSTEDAASVYRKVVADALKPFRARHGFIHYTQARAAIVPVEQLLEAAEKNNSEDEFQHAIASCEAVIEKIVPAFSTLDDSNGVLSGCVSKAMRILQDVADKELPEKMRKTLLTWCLKTATKSGLRGWDAPWDLLALAADIAEAREEDKLLGAIAAMQDDKFSHDKEVGDEKTARVLYRFMTRMKPRAEVLAFVADNLDATSMRTVAIHNAVDAGDFSLAIRLAEEGRERAHGQRHYGTETAMMTELLEIYRAMKDRANVVKMAETLFRHDRYNDRYYHVLKQEMDTGEWEKRRPAYLEKMRKEGDYRSLAGIFSAESSWADLVSALEVARSVELMEKFEDILLPLYHDRLLNVHLKIAGDELVRAGSSALYRRVAKRLKSLLARYDEGAVRRAVAALRAEYPFRSSLIAELRIIPPPAAR